MNVLVVNKQEDVISLDALIYYLDENMVEDDDSSCDCGCTCNHESNECDCKK